MPKVKEQLVKSKERVRDLAEVYTPTHIISDMLDLPGVKEASEDIWTTFLEPACGDGRFLEAIVGRKIDALFASYKRAGRRPQDETLEFNLIAAVSTVYGIDICRQNVAEARARVTKAVYRKYVKYRPKGFTPHESFLGAAADAAKKDVTFSSSGTVDLGYRGRFDPTFSEDNLEFAVEATLNGHATVGRPGFGAALEAVLEGTVVLGNALEGATTTIFTEFIPERNGPDPKPGRKDARSFSRRFRTQKHTLKSVIDEQSGAAEQLTLVDSAKPAFPVTAPVHFLELGTMALVEEAA